LAQYDIDPMTGALSPKTPATIPTDISTAIAVGPLPHVPTCKDHGKNGGWQQFGFMNQGHCIAFVNRQ
jgi:hypothetical protein